MRHFGVVAQPIVQALGEFGEETSGLAKPVVFLAQGREFFFHGENGTAARAVAIGALVKDVRLAPGYFPHAPRMSKRTADSCPVG